MPSCKNDGRGNSLKKQDYVNAFHSIEKRFVYKIQAMGRSRTEESELSIQKIQTLISTLYQNEYVS